MKRYPLQLVTPHPRFSFHTTGDGKGSWSDGIKAYRVIIEGFRGGMCRRWGRRRVCEGGHTHREFKLPDEVSLPVVTEEWRLSPCCQKTMKPR